ncbi:hypothetical protein [Paludisphaera soli]|uniref:hypothetical protein n=1 Tax=Paludisphaera soli TaxID=2712865 RepID=UPI0013E9D486|nr:hypothetical protein [Paludisphaera soli]
MNRLSSSARLFLARDHDANHPMNPRPSDAKILEDYLRFLESTAFKPTLRKLAGRPWYHIVMGVISAATTIGIPIALYHLYRILTHKKRVRKGLIAVAKAARPITTHPLMVNSALTSVPGTVAPGMVIGSFQPRARQDAEYWLDLAVKLSFLSPEVVETPEEKAAARWLSDEGYVESRRLCLPMSLTDGCEVFAFHVMIPGDYFTGGLFKAGELPCVAVPGPVGAIQAIPWWIARGERPPA